MRAPISEKKIQKQEQEHNQKQKQKQKNTECKLSLFEVKTGELVRIYTKSIVNMKFFSVLKLVVY